MLFRSKRLRSPATRKHPNLKSLKIEGSESLPIAQLRGAQGAEPNLNMNHKNLGALSAHAMGTLLQGNMLLKTVSLDHNVFGADGIRAIAEGLGEAPIKSLHIKNTGLQGAEDPTIMALSASICSHLGQLSELCRQCQLPPLRAGEPAERCRES